MTPVCFDTVSGIWPRVGFGDVLMDTSRRRRLVRPSEKRWGAVSVVSSGSGFGAEIEAHKCVFPGGVVVGMIDRVSDTPDAGFEERHFTISQIAQMWNLSEELVRQLVRNEPGVTEWVRQAPGKRRYRVLRIPQSVADRLYRRAQERANLEAANLVSGRRLRSR